MVGQVVVVNVTAPFTLLVATLGAVHVVNCLHLACLCGRLFTLPSLVLLIALAVVLIVPFLIVV